MEHRPGVRFQRQFDPDDGEIRTVGILVEPRPHPRPGKGRDPFMMVYDAAAELLDLPLTPVEMRLVLYFVTKGRMNEPLTVNQSRIARDLGHAQATVNRAMGTLVRHNILVRDDTCPRCYWLNPVYAWRGHEEDRKKVVAKLHLVPS